MTNKPILLLLVLYASGMMMARSIGQFILEWMFPGTNTNSLEELTAATPLAWNVIRVIQFIHSLFSMLLPAVLTMKWVEGTWIPSPSTQKRAPLASMVYIPILLFTLLPLMQSLYVFNQGLNIPGQLGEMLRAMEEHMNMLIEGMLRDDSPGAWIFNILLVVVMAAVAEELFFRGALQRFLTVKTGDVHLSILISAAIFSLVHMQFFGFLPRMALGILFGYLYWRTGRLLAPMLAHALFNGLQIGTYYYAMSDSSDKEMDDMMFFPMGYTVASTLLFFMMYYSFHQYTEKKE